MTRTERCVAIALLEQKDKLTREQIREYSRMFQVTERTIYRDLGIIGRVMFLIKTG